LKKIAPEPVSFESAPPSVHRSSSQDEHKFSLDNPSDNQDTITVDESSDSTRTLVLNLSYPYTLMQDIQ
jgi:hypothetical protein